MSARSRALSAALSTVLFLSASPSLAQDLAGGYCAEGRFQGIWNSEPVRFVSVYYEEQKRHSLRAGRIFGHPQVSLIAATIDADGIPGRPTLLLSVDPASPPGEDPANIIGEAQIIGAAGRDAPLRAEVEMGRAALDDFELSPNGEVAATMTLQFYRFARGDGRSWVQTDYTLEGELSGTFTRQLAEEYGDVFRD